MSRQADIWQEHGRETVPAHPGRHRQERGRDTVPVATGADIWQERGSDLPATRADIWQGCRESQVPRAHATDATGATHAAVFTDRISARFVMPSRRSRSTLRAAPTSCRATAGGEVP